MECFVTKLVGHKPGGLISRRAYNQEFMVYMYAALFFNLNKLCLTVYITP